MATHRRSSATPQTRRVPESEIHSGTGAWPTCTGLPECSGFSSAPTSAARLFISDPEEGRPLQGSCVLSVCAAACGHDRIHGGWSLCSVRIGVRFHQCSFPNSDCPPLPSGRHPAWCGPGHIQKHRTKVFLSFVIKSSWIFLRQTDFLRYKLKSPVSTRPRRREKQPGRAVFHAKPIKRRPTGSPSTGRVAEKDP